MDMELLQLTVTVVCLTYVASAGWQLIFRVIADKCRKH